MPVNNFASKRKVGLLLCMRLLVSNVICWLPAHHIKCIISVLKALIEHFKKFNFYTSKLQIAKTVAPLLPINQSTSVPTVLISPRMISVKHVRASIDSSIYHAILGGNSPLPPSTYIKHLLGANMGCSFFHVRVPSACRKQQTDWMFSLLTSCLFLGHRKHCPPWSLEIFLAIHD